MSESTIAAIVVALIGAISAIIVAIIQNKKEKSEEDTHSKGHPNPKTIGLYVVILFVIAASLLGFIGGLLSSNSKISSPPSVTIAETPTITQTPSPTIPLAYLELTAIADETQRAVQRSTTIALITQNAGATSTQQYISVLQTAQANLEATRIYDQAQQQLATEQAQNAEATAQVVIAIQQTATANAVEQSSGKILQFATSIPSFSTSLLDTFDDNQNGWSPKIGKGYNVSIKDGALKVKFSDPALLPFIWTCDTCGSFNKFSYQIDIKTPKGIPRIVAGILFGSPTRIDEQPFQESYALSIYSTGAILLERFSPTGRDTIQLWDHRPDLITPDGNFHTLQIIGIDKNATIYVDGKLVGDVLTLNNSTTGYIGLVVQSTDVDILYDNMKVISIP